MSHLGGWVSASKESGPNGDRSGWTPELWDWLVKEYKIRSVLDVGCGPGYHLEWFHNKIGNNIKGLEGDPKAVNASRNVLREYITIHDFCESSFAKLCDTTFDLVWSCEFLEHVEEKYLSNILDTFSNYCTNVLAITHALPGQGGYHHVNCRDDMYWINAIQSTGYFRIDWTKTLASRKIAGHGYYLRSGLLFTR